MSKPFEYVMMVSTIVLLLLAGVLAIQPSGVIRTLYADWLNAVRAKRFVEQEWASLSGGSPIVGSVVTNRRIVEFIDYTCPYCRLFHDTLDVFLKRNVDAAVVLRHAPNRRNPVSRAAAIAVICADSQGVLPAMHTFLLTDTSWLLQPDWMKVAGTAGVPALEVFRQCMVSDEAFDRLAADSVLVQELGIGGTPTFVSEQGDIHVGIVGTVDRFREWLE